MNIFADGLGFIISSLGVPESVAISFVALTVSAFAFTTLDTCTRLARFTFQEFFDDMPQPVAKKFATNRYLATTVVVILSGLMLLSGEFTTLWPIFGSANQLLAALALLTVAVWLIKTNEKATFVLIPMFFMFAVTLCSLFLLAIDNFMKGGYLLFVIATILFILTIVLIILAKKCLKKERELV